MYLQYSFRILRGKSKNWQNYKGKKEHHGSGGRLTTRVKGQNKTDYKKFELHS